MDGFDRKMRDDRYRQTDTEKSKKKERGEKSKLKKNGYAGLRQLFPHGYALADFAYGRAAVYLRVTSVKLFAVLLPAASLTCYRLSWPLACETVARLRLAVPVRAY